MPNPQNLKPFTGADDPRRATGALKKGTEHSATRLRRLLDLVEKIKNPVTGEIEGFTVLEQLDLQQIIRARKGDAKSYELLLDRLEGKPKQTIDNNIKGTVNIDDPHILQTLLLTAQMADKAFKKKNETPDPNPTPPKQT